jgi:hypothetical protein
MRSKDRTTRKATPRKIKASPKEKTNDANRGWLQRAVDRHQREMREDNRVFAVFAGAILKAPLSMEQVPLSMEQKIELLESVSRAIRDDRVRRIYERDLHKAEQAYYENPNKKTGADLAAVKRHLAGLEAPDKKTVERYLGRPPTHDEIDQMERGVPLSTIVANIIAIQRLPSPSAQHATDKVAAE